MAKPNFQAGHGAVSGTANESSLAHGEAAGRDAEGDGGSEADWDVPAATDNSPLSRILGLILVVVLAGVFSFVAYRKYDEARRNPSSQTVADALGGGASPADSPLEPGATSSSGEVNGRSNSTAGAPAAAGGPSNSYSRNGTASADAFQSLDEAGPNRSGSGAYQSPKHDYQTAAAAARTPSLAAGRANAPAAREVDANPFGDLGSSSERQPRQPPAQAEPLQQLSGGTTLQPAGGPHAPSGAAADADMQNLFPNENNARHDRPAQSPQNLATRGTSLEPTALTRTASAQNPPAQNPPGQSEPLDNELLDESHPHAPAVADDRGVTRIHQDSRGPNPRSANAGVPTAGRAEALLGSNERTPSGDESSFRNSQLSTGSSQRSVTQPAVQPISQSHSTASGLHASSATVSPGSDVRSPSASEDPFASNRPSAGGGLGERSAASPAVETSASQTGRLAAAPGSVSTVATTSDAGDYYVVQPQDNFWTISRKKYGTSRYFLALAELNKARIPDPARMRPGMKVSTPSAEMLEERYGQFLPPGTKVQVASAEEASAKSAPIGFFVSPDGTPKYRTGEKDTLSDIAAKHLGRSSRWIQIYEMNRDKLSSPNQLKVGTELALPGDASSVGLSSDDDDRR